MLEGKIERIFCDLLFSFANFSLGIAAPFLKLSFRLPTYFMK
jgi:hypothetical protein